MSVSFETFDLVVRAMGSAFAVYMLLSLFRVMVGNRN